MTIYWLMFAVAALGAFAPWRLPQGQSRLIWFAVGALFTVLIGLRYEVGADWFRYIYHFELISEMSFTEAVTFKDPAYYGLSWIFSKIGGDKTWVNLVCAAALLAGTLRFCRRQPFPWLALLAAVPYLLIVVGMGYTRQSAAIGFALIGLVALGDGKLRWFVFWIVIGALFHKSALVLIPIAAVAASRNRLITSLSMLVTMGLMYYLLVDEGVDFLWSIYIDRQMYSEGGAVRVLMNVVPACLLLLFAQKLVPERIERRLWIWMALFALACLPLLIFASTAVDRIALYLIPLQMYVFSRLPKLAASPVKRTPFVVLCVVYFACAQYVWMNYAGHAEYWIPYKFAPVV